MQSPARSDEDTRGGFRHGGWATAAGERHPARLQELARRLYFVYLDAEPNPRRRIR